MRSFPTLVVLALAFAQCPRVVAQHCMVQDTVQESPGASDDAMGVGLVRPIVEAGRALYLYGAPEVDATVRPDVPVDSIAFSATPYGTDISYAPPWFFPEVVKLDYNLFYLRALSLRRQWVEVVVNKADGRTAWILRDDADFVSWPEFIVNVFAVERTAPGENPLRARPFAYSDPVADQGGGEENTGEENTDEASSVEESGGFWEPLAVRNHWLLVRRHTVFDDQPDKGAATGWIIWRESDRLCVTYSLLS